MNIVLRIHPVLLTFFLSLGLAQAAPVAYISNSNDGTVSVVDTETNAVTSTVRVNPGPVGIAVHPAETRVYVTHPGSNPRVSVIDTATNTLAASIVFPADRSPYSIAVHPNGTRVYVTDSRGLSASVIDTASNSIVADIPLGATSHSVVVHPAGTRAYVTHDRGLSVIDTLTNTVIATVTVGVYPFGLAISPDGTRLYVADNSGRALYVIDASTYAILTQVPIAVFSTDVAVHPNGSRVYVTHGDLAATVTVIDTATNSVIATPAVPNSPRGIAIRAAGDRAYVVDEASNSVSVLDTATNVVTAVVPVGSMPRSIGLLNRPATPTPALTFSPQTAIFPPQAVGTTSAAQNFTVSNTSAAPVNIIAIVPRGDFSALHNCPAMLQPGGSCVLTITFTPTGAGPRFGTITVTGTSGSWVLSLVGAPYNGPYAYITHLNSNYVTVLDVPTNQVVKTIITGTSPEAVAVAPNGGVVYVGNYLSDTVSVIDVPSQSVIGTIAVGDGPKGMAVLPDSSRLYVANNGAGSVSVVDAISNSVAHNIQVGTSPWGVVASRDGKKVYVANGESDSVSVIDVESNTVSATVSVGNRPFGIVASPDGAWVYVANFGSNSVSIISTESSVVAGTVFVDSGPFGLALSPYGSRLYVTTNQNTVSVVDLLTRIKLASILVGNHPMGISVTPDGRYAYVASFNDGAIVAIDLLASKLVPIATLADGPVSFGAFITPANTIGTAVEYYYAGFDHYFVTASSAEQSALDNGAFNGAWIRTGKTFKVWAQSALVATPSWMAPVCRFFSTAFGTKSSHFYTPFSAECEMVKTYREWQYEGIAFHVQVPSGYGSGSGDCANGTDRFYRLYNNGKGGAPNHRYATDPAVLDAMIAQGWVMEGEAATRVFACVPVQ